MDDVVGNVGEGKFQAAMKAQRLGEDEGAIQIVGDEITGEVTAVESDVVIGNQKGIEPRQKCPIEGIDAADDEEEDKFPGEKMMSNLMYEMHAAGLNYQIGRASCRERV